MRKAVGFSSTSTTQAAFSSCSFYKSAAYVQLEFGESAASIWVRLLIKCGFYTRLYGTKSSKSIHQGFHQMQSAYFRSFFYVLESGVLQETSRQGLIRFIHQLIELLPEVKYNFLKSLQNVFFPQCRINSSSLAYDQLQGFRSARSDASVAWYVARSTDLWSQGGRIRWHHHYCVKRTRPSLLGQLRADQHKIVSQLMGLFLRSMQSIDV